MNFEITDTVNEKDRESIRSGLLEYNLARLEDRNPKELGIYYKKDGVIMAGLTGHTHGNWLEIQFLWVAEELRGHRIGSAILKEAEKTALERGCKYSFVDTFSFQAPDFYPKYGYTEAFRLEEYPLTGKRHYYVKCL